MTGAAETGAAAGAGLHDGGLHIRGATVEVSRLVKAFTQARVVDGQERSREVGQLHGHNLQQARYRSHGGHGERATRRTRNTSWGKPNETSVSSVSALTP